MIEIYTGTPGSGKSYHIVSKIYNWNRKKLPVISNIILDVKQLRHPEMYFYVDTFDLSEAKVLEIAQEVLPKDHIKEHSLLLVLDECQLFLNARDFHDVERKHWLHFFTIHRHLGIDVVMIAQDMSFIDKQARLLAEYELRHMNVGKIHMFRFFELLIRHRIFLVKTYHIGTKFKCENEWCLGRKKIYRIYNTFQAFPTVETVKKSGASE